MILESGFYTYGGNMYTIEVSMSASELKWARYFFDLIKVIKSKSKDPNTKVGCVLVGNNKQILSTGYNDFPFGVKNNPSRRKRPRKYSYTVHAEANCLLLAARSGVTTNNTTLYVQALPCNECTKLIIQSGIKRIIYEKSEWAKWKSQKYNEEHMKISLEMLNEAKIEIIGV